MKEKLILIGGGGHCKSCIDVIEQENKYEIAGIVDLKENIDLNNGQTLAIDQDFSAYSVGSHLLSDFYDNKIAFIIALKIGRAHV